MAEIQAIIKHYQWGHVISQENPADVISRGVQPSQLKTLDIWWLGPSWLSTDQVNWPQNHILDRDLVPERKELKLVFASVIEDFDLFNKFSNLFKLQKVVAFCLRFFNNLKTKQGDRLVGDLSVEELDKSLLVLVCIMQRQVFREELATLELSKPLSKHCSISSLDPFLDKNGIIRVGGRLRNANMTYSEQFPIILGQKHILTKLIILDYHHKQLHAGSQALLASLRTKYWIVNGRSAVRSVLCKCMTCFRVSPQVLSQKMGNLPKDRVVPNRPFLISGVDLAGPYNLKDGKLRNRAIVKGYMCLFICFTTKATHIELVGDLSSNSFLNALKRFVSRRGLCSRLYSDNATNFAGANNELQKISHFLSNLNNNNDFRNFCLKFSIDWKYIPPRSPHHGGLWESAIRSAKYHLSRILNNNTLTFEDMLTLLAQVESVLNSRPLYPLSNDPKDLLALTPGHFLIGDSLNAIPQKDVTDIPSNRLQQYQLLQKMFQLFWFRWSSEYLSLLQQRYKWKQPIGNIQEGTLVVIKEDGAAPLNWRLGRVVAVHPGPDNLVRVVSVQTVSGILKRAVQKVCPLPIDTLPEHNMSRSDETNS